MNRMKRLGLGGVAAAGAAALVIGLAAPAMAAGTFDTSTPVVGGPSSLVLPKSGAANLTFTFQFEGPGAPNEYTAKPTTSLINRNARVKSSYVVSALDISSGGKVEPGPPAYNIPARLYAGYYVGSKARLATPGKYRVSIPVTSTLDNVVRTGHKDVTVTANTTVSKNATGFRSPSIRAGKTRTITVTAPYYQAGAKATAYFKAKGKKKFKKVGSATLNTSTADFSKARIKIPGKYTKTAGHIYIKISGAPYAPGYKLKTIPVKIVRR